MKLKELMVVKSVICLVFGVGFVAIPGTVFGWYGVTLDAGGTLIAQLFGQAFILIALFLWLARNTMEPETLAAIAIAVFIGDVIGTVVSVFGVLNGVTNSLGWLTVALYLVLALGFGYFVVRRPIA
jgi:heme A synthase